MWRQDQSFPCNGCCHSSSDRGAMKNDDSVHLPRLIFETPDLTKFEAQVLPRWLKNFQIIEAGKPVEGAFSHGRHCHRCRQQWQQDYFDVHPSGTTANDSQ